jgi:hypothetical protein
MGRKIFGKEGKGHQNQGEKGEKVKRRKGKTKIERP